MKERIIHLRIKIKSLAEEARIIRKEAKKTEGDVRYRLNHHRKQVVRVHSRINLLAYGILKGTPYFMMEESCRYKPDFKEVERIALRFGAKEGAVNAWIREAKDYYSNHCRMAA